MPAGQDVNNHFSALVNLLPYVEQDNCYASINFALPISDPANDCARTNEIKTFRCPADVDNPLPSVGAQTSYMANKGNGIVWDGNTGPNAGMPAADGVFYYGSRVRFADIYDGLSNTAFYSERIIGDGSNAIVSPIADVFLSFATPISADEAAADCSAVDINNLSNQFPFFMGAPWMDGQHCYLHATPPDSRSCGFLYVLRAVMPPSSRHGGGVNVLAGDGAVRFVRDEVDLKLWRAFGSRDGGEVLAGDI